MEFNQTSNNVGNVSNQVGGVGWVRKFIQERLKQHADNLAMWQEPDGFLIPTEPDPEEREMVRQRLNAAIFEINKILEFTDEFIHPKPDRQKPVIFTREGGVE